MARAPRFAASNLLLDAKIIGFKFGINDRLIFVIVANNL